jgi:hypothetical protein
LRARPRPDGLQPILGDKHGGAAACGLDVHVDADEHVPIRSGRLLRQSGIPVPFTLGRVATAGFVLLTVYAFVCFPRDHLAPGQAAWFVHALAVMTAIVWALALALTPELPVGGPVAQCSGACPRNALQLVSAPDPVSHALTIAINALSALGLVGATAALVAKARSPD